MSVTIKINHAKKVYDNKNVVIPDLSLQVEDGEFFTLLGPSGCGKTTLLRMIAGFNTIEGGDFYFNDKRINNLPPYKRNVGMVFQNYAVFPHMTTKENVAFGLKEHHVKEPELSKRIDDILKMVQISDLKDRMPGNMSGGQQQRIALARAIVIQPDVLLMDEPLSNLDAKLRVEMRSAIKHIQQKAGITTVYVTHDQEEAMAISDRIAVMNKGVIQQIGTPVEVYKQPNNLFVATFMGQTNVIDAKYDSKEKVCILNDGTKLKVPNIKKETQDLKVKLCVRPNEFSFADSGIEGVINERVFFGSTLHYNINSAEGNLLLTCDANEAFHEINETIRLKIQTNVINVFDVETGNTIMEKVKS